MKTLNTRWRLVALVPMVAIAILSIGNRTGVVPAQNREAGDGIVVQGGKIGRASSRERVLRFDVARLANDTPGPPGSNAHPGGGNLELKVFEADDSLRVTHASS